MVSAAATFTDADLAYLSANFRTLEQICADRSETPADVRRLMDARLLPRPSYVLDDGTELVPPDYFDLADAGGGPDRARELFAAVDGVVVQDDPSTSTYPLATEAAGSDDIFVGRVRQDPSIDGDRGIAFWVVSDNLRKGAATNAVELAELLVNRDQVRAASRRAGAPAGGA